MMWLYVAGSVTLRTCALPLVLVAPVERIAGEAQRDQVDLDEIAGELVDGVGNLAQRVEALPLVRAAPARGRPRRRPTRRRRTRPTTGRSRAGQRIDDRRAVLERPASAGSRPAARRRSGPARSFRILTGVQAALAVADQHRPHAVVLVLPRDEARELRRAAVRAVRPVAVAGIADAALPDSPCRSGNCRTIP